MVHLETIRSLSFAKTIVIGGGHCGVNMACWLQQKGQPYLILESRDKLLGQWRDSRWDDFQLNTPHRFSKMYGQPKDNLLSDKPGPFFAEQIKLWEKYVESMNLNHMLGFKVTDVTLSDKSGDTKQKFIVTGTTGNSEASFLAENVIVCTGMYQNPKVPEMSKKLPPHIRQMHSRDFRNPSQFPETDKAVLVVGGGQSGFQIARVLQKAGKQVYLCTSSKIPGAMRSYRGLDIFVWIEKIGMLTMTNEQRDQIFPPEKSYAMKYGKLPIVGATESLSAFSLHRDGVEILGSLKSCSEDAIEMVANRCGNVQHSVDSVRDLRTAFANWIKANGQDDLYEPKEIDAAWDMSVPELLEDPGRLSIPLSEIQGVIWATGYSSDFSWLKIPDVIEKDFDKIRHTPKMLCSPTVKGLYYSGFPWLRTSQSLNIVGFNGDHEIIANEISGGADHKISASQVAVAS